MPNKDGTGPDGKGPLGRGCNFSDLEKNAEFKPRRNRGKCNRKKS